MNRLLGHGPAAALLLVTSGIVGSTERLVPRIIVGPNVLVSREGDLPHIELAVAVNPQDARNLVGGAMTFSRPNGAPACRAYSTTDGGATWSASEFADQIQWGGFDPSVAITPRGTAVFAALSYKKDEHGRTSNLQAYRSEDGGRTWSAGQELGYGYDHEQFAIDGTSGPRSGRIYLAAQYGAFPNNVVGAFYSDDDGKSWVGPIDAATGSGKAINTANPMVLSDGALVLPYAAFEIPQPPGKAAGTVWTVVSGDGGGSFGAPRKVGEVWYDFGDKIGRRLGSFISFASHSAGGRDRIYAVWPDARASRMRILFSRSDDRGMHWSAPVPVDPSVPTDAYQYQSAIAVNRDGIIGICWFDTRGSADAARYREYFTASVDGGVTFLPPVPVSSADSMPLGPGNMVFEATVRRARDMSSLTLSSAASNRNGGDYMGLTADRDGVFHPFWVDARTGTFQIYSATISVVTVAKPVGSQGACTKSDLGDRVEVLLDPPRYDAATRRVEVPVRLKNTSRRPIEPPLTLTILGFDLAGDPAPSPSAAVSIANATNGKTSTGAVFDFSKAVAGGSSLEPGAMTNPVVLQLELADPAEPPPIRFRVEGCLRSTP